MAAPAEAPPVAAAEPVAVSWVAFPEDGVVKAPWCVALAAVLEAASNAPPAELPRWLPAAVLEQLIAAATAALTADETLVQLTPPPEARVTVVGDTHGQLHDVLRLFGLAGWPSPESLFVLNGDFVDRRELQPRTALHPPCLHPAPARRRLPTAAPARVACAHLLPRAGARGVWR